MAFADQDIFLRTGERIPFSALQFATSRGGGPGGQNVNKVETRVEVRLNLNELPELRETTRTTLLLQLGNKLDKEGTLRVVAGTERSQYANKVAAVRRLEALLNKALTPRKKRVPTKPSFASKQRRLQKKEQVSTKKTARRWKPSGDD